jgi:phosphopentomutase
MPRAFILVLDSVGVGGAPDAGQYGDAGADTAGDIAEACARGEGDRPGLRRGPLALYHLARLRLGEACRLASGRVPPNLQAGPRRGRYGCAAEASHGKDTPSGHWEIAGCPVRFDWGYFPNTTPCFPPDLVEALCREAGLPGILGDRHASGTEIIAALGEEHMRTGKPICYTSADSVFQIAAHEKTFGLARLYEVCLIARGLVDRLNIGRVIARPFVGAAAADFTRTANRRDYAAPPPAPTILDLATAAGRDVITVGKIADIFAHRATGRVLKARATTLYLTARSRGRAGLPTAASYSPTLLTSIRSTAIAATSPATPPRSNRSTAACPSLMPSCAQMTSWSSPRITAAIRRFAAPTTRASRRRCLRMALRLPARSGRDRPMPISPRRWRAILVCPGTGLGRHSDHSFVSSAKVV